MKALGFKEISFYLFQTVSCIKVSQIAGFSRIIDKSLCLIRPDMKNVIRAYQNVSLLKRVVAPFQK